MMGPRQIDQAALFYEFSRERHVPATHLPRAIDRFINVLEGYPLRSGRTVPNSSLHSPRAEPRCSIICHARVLVFSKMLSGQKGEQNCARSRTDRDHVDQVSRGHQYHW